MHFKYPLATSSWGKEELSALNEVIESNRFTMGERVAQFETAFAYQFGSKYAVMVNSGSSANLIMIAALNYTLNPNLKLSRGDEVIVPAVSWGTTYFPLQQFGLKLKFVDIDLETLNFDLNSLKMAVNDNTRAIFAVNLLGNPNDFEAIKTIIGNRKIILLEDNCESMGAVYKGKYAGTFGVAGSFSSFFSHHICTMEGGIIVTDDEELYHIMLSLRSHGWTRHLPENSPLIPKNQKSEFDKAFNFILPGYNVRPLEMSGALGIEQLRKFSELITGRRKNATYFQGKMQDHPKFLIQKEIGKSSWFGFSLILKDAFAGEREKILIKLDKLGFEYRPIVSGNFLNNKVIEHLEYEISGDLRNATYMDENGFFVGNHHYNFQEAIDHLGLL